MSVFEFIMVMVSVVLALALAQLLRALTEIVTSARRYWVHSAWVGIAAFLVVQTWWAYWDLQQVETWTFLIYLEALLMPILLFMLAHMLVPSNRGQDTDWRAHFFTIRPWFFLIMSCIITNGTLLTWALLGTTLLHPYRLFQVSMLLLTLSGIFLKTHSAHRVMVVVYFSVLLISQLVIRMQLGALTTS